MAEIRDVPADERYEIVVDGAVAGFMDYHLSGRTFVALHTEIDDAYEGQGLGSALVRHVLDEVRGHGQTVKSPCPFVRSYLERHREYHDLVAKES